jgi:hypothetical protein
MWRVYKHNPCEKIRSLHSFTHFTKTFCDTGREREWIKKEKIGARERERERERERQGQRERKSLGLETRS